MDDRRGTLDTATEYVESLSQFESGYGCTHEESEAIVVAVIYKSWLLDRGNSGDTIQICWNSGDTIQIEFRGHHTYVLTADFRGHHTYLLTAGHCAWYPRAMARLARVVAPGFPHHITQRGNRRQQTFFCDEDRVGRGAHPVSMEQRCSPCTRPR